MTKLRAIVNEGPEVVRNAVKLAAARGRARANEVLSNPFRTTAIIGPAQPKRNLELSLERFSYEWRKGKPKPDEYRKNLEKGYEFGK